MYFAKKKNKIYLFLQGNLILSHNDTAVAGNLKTAVPQIHGGVFVHTAIAGRVHSTIAALKFIWGPRVPLDHGKPNVPYRKESDSA